MRFSIIDHIRDGSTADNTKPNDDWLGFNDKIAVVADGATGLADERLIESGDSDAQWIARLAVERFINARDDDPVRDLVREINERAAKEIGEKQPLNDIPRYAWPSSSFIMARHQGGFVEISGLGDCTAFIQMSDGYIEEFSALSHAKDEETKSARQDLALRTNPSDPIRSPEVVEALRKKRELQNTAASGVWTLGLAPEAAEHVFTVAVPASEISVILLTSDGFSAACDAYDICDAAGLVTRAKTDGLAHILADIRRVERLVDPACERFPRYKQSDDSSAILLEMGK